MANPNDKVNENIPGAWYVDTNCIQCGLCDDALPSVFRPSHENGYNYVHRQPETSEELRVAEEVRESCPMESIGNDGLKAAAVELGAV